MTNRDRQRMDSTVILWWVFCLVFSLEVWALGAWCFRHHPVETLVAIVSVIVGMVVMCVIEEVA